MNGKQRESPFIFHIANLNAVKVHSYRKKEKRNIRNV
jgi:hypothetical protein